MKIAIVGGRDFGSIQEQKAFSRILADFIKEGDTIISGGCTGADTLAEQYASQHSIKFICHSPFAKENLRPDGKPGYATRNQRIAGACDIMLAFPTAPSRGTWMTVEMARQLGKRVIVFTQGDV